MVRRGGTRSRSRSTRAETSRTKRVAVKKVEKKVPAPSKSKNPRSVFQKKVLQAFIKEIRKK